MVRCCRRYGSGRQRPRSFMQRSRQNPERSHRQPRVSICRMRSGSGAATSGWVPVNDLATLGARLVRETRPSDASEREVAKEETPGERPVRVRDQGTRNHVIFFDAEEVGSSILPAPTRRNRCTSGRCMGTELVCCVSNAKEKGPRSVGAPSSVLDVGRSSRWPRRAEPRSRRHWWDQAQQRRRRRCRHRR
jgi:hypothetical protein